MPSSGGVIFAFLCFLYYEVYKSVAEYVVNLFYLARECPAIALGALSIQVEAVKIVR